MFSHFKKFFSTTSLVASAVKEQLKKRPVRPVLRQEEYNKPAQSLVLAVCTAESYDLSSLAKSVSGLSLLQNRDVLHFKFQHKLNEIGLDVFFFRHGSFVVWNGTPNLNSPLLIQEIRNVVKPFEKTSILFEETEEIPFM